METSRKKGFAALLLAVLMTVISAMSVPAAAEWLDPIAFTMEATGTEMTGPGEIGIQVRVTNTTGVDMTDPVTLYDPAGNVVTAFGDGGSKVLKAEQPYSWSGVYSVSQEELESGRLLRPLPYDGRGRHRA